jgi:hypothetical protein
MVEFPTDLMLGGGDIFTMRFTDRIARPWFDWHGLEYMLAGGRGTSLLQTSNAAAKTCCDRGHHVENSPNLSRALIRKDGIPY